jgi:hypothetical protein
MVFQTNTPAEYGVGDRVLFGRLIPGGCERPVVVVIAALDVDLYHWVRLGAVNPAGRRPIPGFGSHRSSLPQSNTQPHRPSASHRHRGGPLQPTGGKGSNPGQRYYEFESAPAAVARVMRISTATIAGQQGCAEIGLYEDGCRSAWLAVIACLLRVVADTADLRSQRLYSASPQSKRQ